MLKVINYGEDEYHFPALLVLGCFDAIHAGHRELIKKAKLQAKINGLDLGVMMFRDGKGDKTVYSFEERLAILEELNVKFVLVIDFTEEFKATAPVDFLVNIEEKINVKGYMSGKDFRFGAKAKGKSSTLKNFAEDEENGVWYMPVKDVTYNDEKISTTMIKQYLADGNIAVANELLGSEFCVQGEVVKGAGRGTSQLGYPTVNIVYPEKKFPVKYGVYKVKSVIGGTEYFGIANYGNCPTFGDDRIALEVYFDSFSGDLYGETLTISFISYIRDIQAFASAEELKAQLDKDKATLAEDASAVSGEPTVAEPVASEAPVQQEQPKEEAMEEVVTPVENDIAISSDEFKALESGFDDVVEEITEDVQAAPSEPVEEAPVEEAPVEEAAETVENVEEAAEPIVEETETAEATETVEETPTEETATVEEIPVEEFAEPIVEETETVQPTEPVAEEQSEEAAEEQTEAVETPEEHIETVEEVTEAPVEEKEAEQQNAEEGGEANID